jgi:hypothetical protein
MPSVPRSCRSRVSAALCALVMLCVLLPAAAQADPWERYTEEKSACSDAHDESCNVCGASYHCSPAAVECSWGALTFEYGKAQEVEDKGFVLYCLGGSGTVLSAPSAAGVQLRTLHSAFRTLERDRRKTGLVAGGVFEINAASGAAPNMYGVTIPLSWTFIIDKASDVEAHANVIIGGGDGLVQYGLNLNPVYSRLILGLGEEKTWKVVVGAALPLQFVGTSGEDISFGASWLIGAGGFAGVSRKLGSGAIGAGVTLDLRYTAGLNVPLTFALRSAHDLSDISSWLGALVIMPGLSMDFAAGSALGDTMRVSLLMGLDIGDWIAGYQAFFTGSSSSHGFAVTWVGRAGEMAGGQGSHERKVDEDKKPIVPVPTPPASQPASAPASQPTTAPASQPAVVPTSQPADPASQPVPATPTSQPVPPASQPAAVPPAASSQ